MLTHHRKPVSLSLVSTDMPLWSIVETFATLYQKDSDRFHIVLREPKIIDFEEKQKNHPVVIGTQDNSRLIWLEISSNRVIMTMQENGKLSYRHLWERGVYGVSKFWLTEGEPSGVEQIRLSNYTKSVSFKKRSCPELLRLEYELWTNKLRLGSYVLNLEIY